MDRSKIPTPEGHYIVEYTFDKSANPALWTKQKPGLNLSFATTDELYLRTDVPQLKQETQSWEGTGWKGERLSVQLLIWSPDTVEQIRFKVNDLTSAQGQSFSRKNIRINMERYVLSNFPYNALAPGCGAGDPDSAYLMPDRLENVERFDLPGRTVRPFWISFEIPEGTEAGEYKGTIDVQSEKQNATVNVKVRVQQQTLPRPHDWKFRLDLWQNPWVVAWYYHVAPWSDEHKILLKRHLQPYADAGGTYITTYAIHSPWSDNSYMIEGGMIEWIKRKDGSWNFDYKIFDEYIELCMGMGIDEAITIYSPVPWGYRFRYIDEATGNYVHEEWSPETEKFKANFNLFLDDLKNHLQKKGWLQKTYLGINENPLNITLAAAKVIKGHSKDWRITYAGDWHSELTNILDDYSPVLGKEPTQKELQDRKSKGLTTTYYVCCTPEKPNNFVFSPPLESTYIGWYASAYGYDGFLRWAYDAWPADPLRDARHTAWPAGDCFLVYPGGGSSIRLERLREGIADFEKIHILREAASKSSDKKTKALLAGFEKHLKTFAEGPRNYEFSVMAERVAKGKQMINNLSAALASEAIKK